MLTAKAIEQAKPEDGKPWRRLWDERGLYLEIRRADGGVSKWWRLRYRHDGREKLLSLGTYPDVSLAMARERRDSARKLLVEGVDPSAQRRADKAARVAARAHTLEAVTRAWLDARRGAWKPRTMAMIEGGFVKHVFPTLGAQPLADVTTADVRAVVQAVDAAGAGETAGRVFQRLRAVYRYALQHGIVTTDPTYTLRPSEILRARDVRHRLALSEADAPEFLRKLADYAEPSTREALALLVLTAVRPGELRGARWSEIDDRARQWRIPAERMKMKTAHVVPLSRQALALLKARRAAVPSGDLVFPSPFYPDKPLSENTLNSALARMGYKGVATAHGFRTLFSTAANEAGFSGDVIERQLAHEPRNEVRAAYNRAQHLPERAKLMQWWADRVDTLRKKTAPTARRA